MTPKEKQKKLLIDIMEADAKDGLYKQQTAVEWLKEKVKETYDKEGKLPLGYVLNLIAQAKVMEVDQIVNAWNERAKPYPMEGMGYSVMDATGEQYYNETYGKQEIEKL